MVTAGEVLKVKVFACVCSGLTPGRPMNLSCLQTTSVPGGPVVGLLVKVTVVVCPDVIVAVRVLPESVPPVAVVSVNPLGTFSVTFTVPTGRPVPNGGNEAVAVTQTGPVVLAGTVMLGIVGPPGGVVKLKVAAASVAAVSCLQMSSVPVPGARVAVAVAGAGESPGEAVALGVQMGTGGGVPVAV